MISHYPELNDHSTLTNGSAFSLGGALATEYALAEQGPRPEDELWFSAWHDTDRPVFTSRLTYNPWFGELARAIWEFILVPESGFRSQ